MKRISVVRDVKVLTMLFSASLQAGDNRLVAPRCQVLAVQREGAVFEGDELPFKDFNIFTQPFPTPAREDAVALARHNPAPYIEVGSIHIHGLSTAGVLQIGSTHVIHSESRTKHIRQLLPRND